MSDIFLACIRYFCKTLPYQNIAGHKFHREQEIRPLARSRLLQQEGECRHLAAFVFRVNCFSSCRRTAKTVTGNRWQLFQFHITSLNSLMRSIHNNYREWNRIVKQPTDVYMYHTTSRQVQVAASSFDLWRQSLTCLIRNIHWMFVLHLHSFH